MDGYKPTLSQLRAGNLFASDARHILLYGGSRSGKTFEIVRTIVLRAMGCESRHAILRFRFNHVKSSIGLDTLPKVIKTCWPGLWEQCTLDQTNWVLKVPSADGGVSEIWLLGLDDKDRTEKILGQEFSTMYFNECSQITFSSVETALTRLAQKTKLRNKAYYDCNPPGQNHWLYKQFIQKRDVASNKPLRNPDNYVSMMINPADNEANLDADYLQSLEDMSVAKRKRFKDGLFSAANDNALWTIEGIEQCRRTEADPAFKRILISVDPSGCNGDPDSRSDEIGIIVGALTEDGYCDILEDLSGKHGPTAWGAIVIDAFERYEADCVVAEVNFGGAMVEAVIRAAALAAGVQMPPFKEVRASRGKVARAEPVAALYDQGKVRHAGGFSVLENQMCGMTTGGYTGEKSPDRVDAMVWLVSSIFTAMTKVSSGPQRAPTINLGRSEVRKVYGGQRRR